MSDQLGRRGLFTLGATGALAGEALGQTPQSVIRGRDGWLFIRWDDPATIGLANLTRVAGLMRDAAALIRAKGVEFGFIVIPSKYRIYRDMLPEGQVFTPAAEQRFGIVLQELRQGSPLVPDLGAPMLARRQSAPQDQLFFKADTHWTPLGASVASTELARHIRATIALPAAHAPGTRLGPPTTQTRLRRDLADFVPVAERGTYLPERYVVRAPVAAHGGLLDTAASDVAIVGNSYMMPEYNFLPEFSASMDRPVALEWKVQLVGPFKTLLDYLRGPLFRRERPKLLLWAVIESAMTIVPENRGAYPESNMTGQAFLDGVRQALG